MASHLLGSGITAILCLGVLLLVSGAAAQLSISPASDTAVLQGSPVTIRCHYDQPSVTVIVMQLNGGIIQSLNPPDGSVLTRSSGTTALMISSFSSNHSGQYQCHYASFSSDLLSDTVTMEVAVAPQIERSLPQVMLVNVTQPWHVTCSSSGVPAPDWELVRVGAKDQIVARESPGRSLTFTKAVSESSDSQDYECRARNLAGSDSISFSLLVQTPAKVTSSVVASITPVPINTQFSLSCEATGTPQPRLEWLLNNSTVIPATGGRVRVARTNLTNSRLRSTLTVDRVAEGDAGDYVCRASNLLGQESAVRTVVVQVPPGQPRMVGVISLRQASAILQWKEPVEDGFSAIRVYFVTLEKFATTRAAQVYQVNGSHFQLPLSGLDANSEYNAVVAAENSVGAGTGTPGFRFTTLPVAPPAPSGVQALVVGPTSITIAWTISLSWLPSQASLRYFSISVQDQVIATNISASTRSYDVAGLEKATLYTMSVRSHNWALASSATAAVTQVTTLGTIPSPPVLEDAVGVSSSAIRLLWREPVDNGGLPRQTYMLTWMANAKTVGASAVSHTVGNLLPNRNYTFTLVAVNSLGASGSVQINAQTLATTRELLPVPNLPKVSRSNGSLLVRFPLETLGARASHWLLQYRVSGGRIWQVMTIERNRASQCLDELNSDTQYEIRLAQAAQSERSFYSPRVVTRTLTPDLLPDVIILDVFSETVNLGQALCGVANLRSLVIEYRPAASPSPSASWKRTAANGDGDGVVRVGGLLNNVTYSFRHALLDESGAVIRTSVISTATTLSRPQSGKKISSASLTATIVGVVVAFVVVAVLVAVVTYFHPPTRWCASKVFSPANGVLNNKILNFNHFSPEPQRSTRSSVGFEQNVQRPYHEEMSCDSCDAISPMPLRRPQEQEEQECPSPVAVEESVGVEMLPVSGAMQNLRMVPSSEVTNYAQLQLVTPAEGKVVHSSAEPSEYTAINPEATKRAHEMRAELQRAKKGSFPDNQAELLEHSTV